MKVYNPQWGRDMTIDNKLSAYMEKHGYEPWHTGGGCMAWRKDLRSEGEQQENISEAYLMITYIDAELGNWKDRDDPQWAVGRYKWTDSEESWVCCKDGLTLARAIEVAALLPEPRRNQQRQVPADDLNRPQWLQEFGEEYRPHAEILDLLDDPRVTDQSWHNDVAPHFEAPAGERAVTVELWFYRADPRDRGDVGDSIPDDQPQYNVGLTNYSGYGTRAPLRAESLQTNDPKLAAEFFRRLMSLSKEAR